MSTRSHPTHPHELGTTLAIWAHPDDETYLAAGVMAAAGDAGQRVVCVSLTAGEHGTDDPARWPPPRVAQVRQWEAAASMAVLGVDEHYVFGYPDGGLQAGDGDALDLVAQLIEAIEPDTILTFGPDGMTFHPDHIAVHHLVTTAWMQSGCAARLLYAATTVDFLDRYRARMERWGMYMTDERPTGLPPSKLGLHVRLGGPALDRKVAALRAMASQTAAVVEHLGLDQYREFVAEEAFVDAPRPRTLAELATAWYSHPVRAGALRPAS